jgi:hypothetical protein
VLPSVASAPRAQQGSAPPPRHLASAAWQGTAPGEGSSTAVQQYSQWQCSHSVQQQLCMVGVCWLCTSMQHTACHAHIDCVEATALSMHNASRWRWPPSIFATCRDCEQ